MGPKYYLACTRREWPQVFVFKKQTPARKLRKKVKAGIKHFARSIQSKASEALGEVMNVKYYPIDKPVEEEISARCKRDLLIDWFADETHGQNDWRE